ncbi:MAG: tRNA dimethylallyltransferase, partial [Desulfomonilia bacterium]|nr:tRNA dimethylallyltransferase [Desulfomonilia bacterium]
VARKRGGAFLKKWLDRLDPDSGKAIQPQDMARIIRYLEIILLTGTRPSSFFSRHRFSIPRFSARIACLLPRRTDLYRDIDARVLRMMDLGLMEETSRLLSRGYDPKLKSMQAFAYRHAVNCLEGTLSLDETISLIQRDTRHYAKRQITWLRANTPHQLFDSARSAEETLGRWIESSLDRSR